MNIDRILTSIAGSTPARRRDMRTNAENWLASGDPDREAAARQVIAALDDQEAVETTGLRERLSGMPVAERVVEAFRAAPMSDNERKTIKALLDNPGATSHALSLACGHDSMIWQMHFGNLCKERQAYLWPAEKAERRDGLFFSGILAEYDPKTSGFTMKPDVVAAFAELGLRAARK